MGIGCLVAFQIYKSIAGVCGGSVFCGQKPVEVVSFSSENWDIVIHNPLASGIAYDTPTTLVGNGNAIPVLSLLVAKVLKVSVVLSV